MSKEQLTMFVSDYDKLCDARDMAAYRAVGAISAAICYCRANDQKAALNILTSALASYEHVANKLESYKQQGTAGPRIAAA